MLCLLAVVDVVEHHSVVIGDIGHYLAVDSFARESVGTREHIGLCLVRLGYVFGPRLVFGHGIHDYLVLVFLAFEHHLVGLGREYTELKVAVEAVLSRSVVGVVGFREIVEHGVVLVEREHNALALLNLVVRCAGDGIAVFVESGIVADSHFLACHRHLSVAELAEHVVTTERHVAVVLHSPSVGCCLEHLLCGSHGLRCPLCSRLVEHVLGFL